MDVLLQLVVETLHIYITSANHVGIHTQEVHLLQASKVLYKAT